MELEGELGDRTRYHKIAQKKIFFKKRNSNTYEQRTILLIQ